MIRAILTDVEGTTSSIAFVHTVLFPYAAERLPGFVRARAGEPAVRAQLDAVRAESGAGDDEAAIEVLLGWIRADRKAGPLKALQGMVWEDGYRSGAYRAHVYPEVAGFLARWQRAGLRLAVYSSGSVQAQRLFFAHSEAGDLAPRFSAHFDTAVGGKREAASYRRILQALVPVEASAVLFLSDVAEELDAAAAAGLSTHLICRDGPAPAGIAHPAAPDFATVHAHWGLPG